MQGLDARAPLIVVALLASSAFGFGLPTVPGLPNINLPGLDDLIAELIKEEPPVSTSLEDAVTGAPLMDGYEPSAFQNGDQLPREEDGTWLLAPGAYEFHLESYCLHAGTHGPGGGEGYVMAPLKGSRSGPIGSILHNTWRFPDLPRSDVQMLIWAIESRTRLGDMSAEAQTAARQLLTPEELNQINATSMFDRLAPGGRGAVPDAILDRVMGKMPEAMQAPFRVQARIHNMMVTGSPTFQEIEQLAVLAGDTGNGPGEVPEGRWSWHPNRYFIRYFPDGYSKTVVQIIVPERYRLERDDKGRIISLSDAQGWRVETVYDDAIEPLTVPDYPGLKGYMFKMIRFIGPDPDNANQIKTVEIADRGWTFVGRPVPATVARASGGLVFATNAGPWWGGPAVHLANNGVRNWGETLADWKERVDSAKETYDKVDETRERWEDHNRHGDDSAVDDLTDIKHYEDGLEKATQLDPYDKLDWIDKHLNKVKRAWEWAADQLGGGDDSDGDGDGSGSDNDDGDGSGSGSGRRRGSFGSGGVAAPGDRGRQRLGQSRRSF